ncbi:glycosyltransferase [Nocardioides lianchengensis]|uniref:glycosyltransferase n=1 Tax=Nocardioides lianchengensis TaxID=1045774 RepID=UPI0011143BC3|nr:glycosyltransferase [Nocardioides lianchengensis]NYG13338.1 glycosyltransferase involved in cell wall biosynthesis [Nocardioides lianchengensis]
MGGTSDRDLNSLSRLIELAVARQLDLTFVLALGRHTSSLDRQEWRSVVEGHPVLDQDGFGRVLASCDVAYLPLKESPRSAGHMVAVGAVEAGVPVVTTDVSAIREYLDGTYMRAAKGDESLLDQLREVAIWGRNHAARIREHWRDEYSREAYVARVSAALMQF